VQVQRRYQPRKNCVLSRTGSLKFCLSAFWFKFLSTDQDTTASAGAASGAITSRPTSVSFAIAAGDRIAAKASVAVTLTFTTQTALATGGKITLNYPAGFFAAAPNPAANIAGTTSVGSMTATSAITGSSIVITTALNTLREKERMDENKRKMREIQRKIKDDELSMMRGEREIVEGGLDDEFNLEDEDEDSLQVCRFAPSPFSCPCRTPLCFVSIPFRAAISKTIPSTGGPKLRGESSARLQADNSKKNRSKRVMTASAAR
jgi:hypothetical protein